MAGRRLGYLSFLTGCFVFYLFYQEWFSFFLLVLGLALPWFVLVVSLPAICTVRVWVDCPASVPMGEAARGRLVASCRLPVPPIRGKLKISRPLSGQQWTLPSGAALPTRHCGGLRCQGCKVRVYDYMGLFSFRLKRARPGAIAVHPTPRSMDRGPSGAAPTRYRPKPGGGFAEDYDLRLYHPGDNLRQIHWKMSAKTGKKILREPIEPVRRKTVVTLVLSGDDAAMDRKLGRLQWLGDALSKEQTEFELHTITGSGPEVWQVTGSKAFHEAMAALLFRTPAPEGAAVTLPRPGARVLPIGGDADET